MTSWAYIRHIERTLEARCEVPPPDKCSSTTIDGTPMPEDC